MNCPVCNIELKMGDRQSVEVNYCPTCRGVWLDRGGLDKIIDRSASTQVNAHREACREHDDRDRRGDHEYEYEGRRKKSFLSGLFD